MNYDMSQHPDFIFLEEAGVWEKLISYSEDHQALFPKNRVPLGTVRYYDDSHQIEWFVTLHNEHAGWGQQELTLVEAEAACIREMLRLLPQDA